MLPVTVFDCSSVYLASLEVRQVRSAVPETTTPKPVIYVHTNENLLLGRAVLGRGPAQRIVGLAALGRAALGREDSRRRGPL